MNNDSLHIRTLLNNAVSSLRKAYDESTSTCAKHSIAQAYTAVTLVGFSIGREGLGEDVHELEGCCDPSECCAAI